MALLFINPMHTCVMMLVQLPFHDLTWQMLEWGKARDPVRTSRHALLPHTPAASRWTFPRPDVTLL